MQQVPPDMLSLEVTKESDPDKRDNQMDVDKQVDHPAEFYDSDKVDK
jgi:hypothetical protein